MTKDQQNFEILKHLKDNDEELTPHEAYMFWGVKYLNARINDLIKSGYKIKKIKHEMKSRIFTSYQLQPHEGEK